LTSSD